MNMLVRALVFFLISIRVVEGSYPYEDKDNSTLTAERRRNLANLECASESAGKAAAGANFQSYFQGMKNIYDKSPAGHGSVENTCLPYHQKCGWAAAPKNDLPLFVLSVGLEGAGHHLWTETLQTPVFDCVWINARHYKRDVADGVPRTTIQELGHGFKQQLALRNKAPCKSIYDSEDSFPTGAIRKHGRLFMRPDLINLQQFDGVLFNIKYLLIARNVTDTAMSALRRNFFSQIDLELRTVEHTLTYIESALKQVPCDRVFIAHYEHALANPGDFIEPLSEFLELGSRQKQALEQRMKKTGKKPSRKVHKLTQFEECKKAGLSGNIAECYELVVNLLDNFFNKRAFMWPSFAANGFDF